MPANGRRDLIRRLKVNLLSAQQKGVAYLKKTRVRYRKWPSWRHNANNLQITCNIWYINFFYFSLPSNNPLQLTGYFYVESDWNVMAHVWYMIRNLRCTVTIDSVLASTITLISQNYVILYFLLNMSCWGGPGQSECLEIEYNTPAYGVWWWWWWG